MAGLPAIAFQKNVYSNLETIDRAKVVPPVAKTAISLRVWIGIASAGRWIAYYEEPRDGQKTVATATANPGDIVGNKP
jgi:hypothetical protein